MMHLQSDLLVFLTLLPIFATSPVGLFDISEVQSVSYDAEIGEDFLWFAPELNLRDVSARNIDEFEKQIIEKLPSEHREDYVFVTSKGGQKFACPLPVVETLKMHDAPPKSSKNPKIYAETLAASFYIDKCIVYRTSSWWSYKLCRGQTVEQFHAEPNDPAFSKNILGIFDGNLAVAPFAASTVDRLFYVEESYSAGTFCDLDNHKEPRRTTVRYECDAGLGTNEAYIMGVVEVSPCKYLMHVKVGSLCHYPEFLPVSQANSRKLTCQPYMTRSEVREMLEQQVGEKEKRTKLEKELLTAQHEFKMATERYVAMSKSERTNYNPDRHKRIEAEMNYRAAHYNMIVATSKLSGESLTPSKLEAIWTLLNTADLADYLLYIDYESMVDENKGHLWYYFHDPMWPKSHFPKDVFRVAVLNRYYDEVWKNINIKKYEYDNANVLLGLVKFLKTGKVEVKVNAVVSSAAIYFDLVERGLKTNSVENDWLYRIYDVLNKDDPPVIEALLASIIDPKEEVFPMDDLARLSVSDLFYEIEQNLLELSAGEDEKSASRNALYDVVTAKPATKQIRENGFERQLSLQSERKALRHFEVHFETLLAPIYQLISLRYFQSEFPNSFSAVPSDDDHLWDPKNEDYKFHLNLAKEWVQFSRLLSVGTLIRMRSFFRHQKDEKAVPHSPERFLKEWAHIQKGFENEWQNDYTRMPNNETDWDEVFHSGVESMFSKLFGRLGSKKIEESRARKFAEKMSGYESETYLKDYKRRKEAKAIHSMMVDLLNPKVETRIIHSVGGGSFKKEDEDEELLERIRVMLDFAKEDPEVKMESKKKKIVKEHIKLTEDGNLVWNDMTDFHEVLKAAGFAKDTKVEIKMFDGDGNEVVDSDAEAMARNLMEEVDSIARFQSTQKAYAAKPRSWRSGDEEEPIQ